MEATATATGRKMNRVPDVVGDGDVISNQRKSHPPSHDHRYDLFLQQQKKLQQMSLESKRVTGTPASRSDKDTLIMETFMKNADGIRATITTRSTAEGSASFSHSPGLKTSISCEMGAGHSSQSLCNNNNQLLPPWLRTQSPHLPALYLQVWSSVQIPQEVNQGQKQQQTLLLCDTQRLLPILTSSGLDQNTLANVWSFVNKTIPGQLIVEELFLALSLIAMIQEKNGVPFPWKDVLSQPQPVVPKLSVFRDVQETREENFANFDSFNEKGSEENCNENEDRYQAFRSLDSNSDNKNQSLMFPHLTQQEKIWFTSLTVCKSILHKSFNALLVNHSEESSIEALSCETGKIFALDLITVYFVAKKIRVTFESGQSPHQRHQGLACLLNDIDCTWKPIRALILSTPKTGIDFMEKEEKETNAFITSSSVNKGSNKCCICLNDVCQLSSSPESSSDLIIVKSQTYHSSCLNVYLEGVRKLSLLS